MLWPVLTLLALAALAAAHFWWRSKFTRLEQTSQSEIEKLKQAQQRAASQVRTQQEALLNSMAEGLLRRWEKTMRRAP